MSGPHDHAGMRTPTWVRAALSHPCLTGISRQHLGDLVAELADPWTAQHEAALRQRRGHRRRRAAGAGPKPRLAYCDRVLVTLVVLRFQLPHQALAVLVGVDRATVTRAVHEVRPLLAQRGLAVPGQQQPGVRLRTLADVYAYADALGGGVARRRLRDPGPPPPCPPARTAGVCVGQAQAEHDQDNHLQRRAGTDAVERRGAAGTDARPDRGQHRGHG